jgi:phage/plasmid-like protein (TIGR03299 family)
MTAAVESMAYAGETPWHGLGNKVNNNLTTEEMLVAAKLNWEVHKRPMFLEGGEKVPNKYALCRETDNRVMDVVGSTYKPVQNADAMDFFRKFVVAGKMTMETAGSLNDGQHIWCLARIKGNDFTIGSKDKVQNYLLLSQPHRLGKSMQILYTSVRVVCWNTLTAALGAHITSAAASFRMAHSVAFTDNVKAQAEKALGLAVEQVAEFKEAAQLLSSKTINQDELEAFFGQVMKFDPDEETEVKKRTPVLIPMFHAALEHAPGATLDSAKGTWWGALNAVTYVVDHEIGKGRDTALKTAWFGGKANLKRGALDLAMKMAA